jgi:cobalt-zinc-cadmium efflux system membrane fusion protein
MLRIGMFVTATFHGHTRQVHAVVPASAVLHLHDRDWVYVPTSDREFRRVGVVGGNTIDGTQQEILLGIKPGERLVANALVLENSLEQ